MTPVSDRAELLCSARDIDNSASCHSDWLHCTKLWSVSSELKVPLVSVIEESDELKQSRCVNIKVFPVVSVPSEEHVRTCSV